jgi:hypothetical protein
MKYKMAIKEVKSGKILALGNSIHELVEDYNADINDIETISIDYLVSNKCKNLKVVKGQFTQENYR